ncbi:unnamed protein product [Parnassius apollo]|uniref:(apollo) hypothetical protein n=1 Tax=Parnassius apollo TaxID=110799 RepID=A0A8S3XYN1_PARAO|nr:unnamed protein product [Parnassius apollo]
MSRKMFFGTNRFIGLEEAIAAVTSDSDDDREYDLAIITPDSSVVTAEDQGFDEDMVIYTLPRDVPENIKGQSSCDGFSIGCPRSGVWYNSEIFHYQRVNVLREQLRFPSAITANRRSTIMPDANAVAFSSNEKWRINRNIFILGFAFMVHFTAFHGTANLQSSVNSDAGAGTFTLAAIYFSLILSNIFLPAIVIKWLGCKWTVALSFIAYMPFIAAQFYPRLYTLVPAGMMVGFGGGPLWCAKCTYLSVVAEPYAKLSGVSSEVLVVRFFGLFFMFYQMAQIWGNLLSSAILSSSLGDAVVLYNETIVSRTSTLITNLTTPEVDFGATCGVNFCSGSASHENANLEPPSALKIQVIAGVYLACMASAVILVFVGVDSLSRYSAGRQPASHGKSGLLLLAVTLRQLRHKYQLLLLPVIGYIGAEQAFMAADFTQAFVGCAYGISNIGFVMICFGIFNALAAPVAGVIVKITGRYPVMVTALILNLCLITSLLLWRPSPDQWLVFFILAAIWGAADAVWLVQVNALSGILFPGDEEAAFSNFRLWESTGSVLAYASAPYLCVRTRLYILLGLLILGFSGYTIIELMEYRVKKSHHRERNFELVPEKLEQE